MGPLNVIQVTVWVRVGYSGPLVIDASVVSLSSSNGLSGFGILNANNYSVD